MGMGLMAAVLGLMLLTSCGKDEGESLTLPVVSDSPAAGTEAFGISAQEGADEGTAASEGASVASEGSEQALTKMVYVCGAVVTPGVYELPQESRIVDALIAAGGFTPEAASNYLNQAKPLSDGEMIYVPTREELENSEASRAVTGQGMAGAVSSSSGQEQTESGLININTADKSRLMTITGVGEAKAEKIIAYREESGSFRAIEDIMNVPGIKEGMFNKIKDQICVK